MTIKALLQLKDLLLWGIKSFCFSGYTIWKAMQGSAGDKGAGRCPGTRADSKTWVLLKAGFGRPQNCVRHQQDNHWLHPAWGKGMSANRRRICWIRDCSFSQPPEAGHNFVLGTVLSWALCHPLRLLTGIDQSCTPSSTAKGARGGEASLKPPQAGGRNDIKIFICKELMIPVVVNAAGERFAGIKTKQKGIRNPRLDLPLARFFAVGNGI